MTGTLERDREVHERFDVLHQVPLVPQLTGMSCWAAGAAMIIGWRDCVAVDAGELARGSGRWEEYRDGLRPRDVDALARAWGLASAPALPLPPARLRRLLEEHGPLWVGEASPDLHVVVVAGTSGDGTSDGTRVRIVDPWPIGRGERYAVTHREFTAGLEAASRLAGTPPQLLFSSSPGRGARFTQSVRTERRSSTWRGDGAAARLGAPRGLLELYLRPQAPGAAPPGPARRPALLAGGAARGYWTTPEGHVREWTLPDRLERVTEAVPASPAAGDPTAFVLGGRRHVAYRDHDGALRLCGRGERWYGRRLPAAPAAGDPQALEDGVDVWLFYRGVDGLLHALRGGAHGWRHEPGATRGGDPAVWRSRDGPRAAVRRAEDGHVVVLGWGAGREPADVTAASGAPPAAGVPSAVARGDQDCIAFTDPGGRVHLVEGRAGRWVHADAHAAVPAAPRAASRPCATASGPALHVVYRAADDRLHVLTRAGTRWSHTDLSAAAAGAVAAAGDPAAGVVGGAPHVLYVGRDGTLHALVLGEVP